MSVPILGQPFTVLCAYSTAIIRCSCEAAPILSLHGKERPTICPACRRVFAIAKSGEVQIGQVIRREAAGVTD